MDLTGKVALVTGGGTGIGAAIAHSYASAGATVAIVGRRVDVLEATAADIRGLGGDARAVCSDVTQLDRLGVAVDDVVGELGRLDIVVANAGTPTMPGPVLDLDPEEWQHTLDVNLTATWNTARVTVPHLKDAGGGHLLVIGSSAGRTRNAEWVGAYGAAKAGSSHLARVLAWELAPDNIAVNEITPGLVITPGLLAIGERLPPGTETFSLEEIGDWIKEPEEVGRLALYITSLPPRGTTGQSFNLERNR